MPVLGDFCNSLSVVAWVDERYIVVVSRQFCWAQVKRELKWLHPGCDNGVLGAIESWSDSTSDLAPPPLQACERCPTKVITGNTSTSGLVCQAMLRCQIAASKPTYPPNSPAWFPSSSSPNPPSFSILWVTYRVVFPGGQPALARPGSPDHHLITNNGHSRAQSQAHSPFLYLSFTFISSFLAFLIIDASLDPSLEFI